MATLANYQLIEIGGETTFGTAATYYDYLECAEVVARDGITQESLERTAILQRDYPKARIPGRRNGSVTLKFFDHGWSSSIPSAAPAATSAELEAATAIHQIYGLLGSALGGLYAGGYVDSDTIGFSTPNLTATTLTSFASGQAVAWATGVAARPYEVAWAKALDTSGADILTPFHTPDVDPQGTTLWGSAVAYHKTGDPYHSTVKSWTIKVTNYDTLITLVGAVPTALGYEKSAGGLGMWTVTLTGSYHTETATGALPAAGTWSLPDPEPGLVWSCVLGTDSGVRTEISRFAIDFGLTRNMIQDGAAVGGIGGFFTPMRRPRITIQVPRDDLTQDGYFTGQTAVPVHFWTGTRPGKITSFFAPACRVIERPSIDDVDSRVMTTMTLEPQEYTGDTGTVADASPIDTSLRVAWL